MSFGIIMVLLTQTSDLGSEEKRQYCAACAKAFRTTTKPAILACELVSFELYGCVWWPLFPGVCDVVLLSESPQEHHFSRLERRSASIAKLSGISLRRFGVMRGHQACG